MLVGALFIATAIFGVMSFPIVLRLRGPAHKDPIVRVWRLFLKKLEKAGVTSLPSDGAMELAKTASISLPAKSFAIHRIAHLYTQSRYAPIAPAFADLKQAIHEFHPKKSRFDVR
jgi:hypothetical protein